MGQHDWKGLIQVEVGASLSTGAAPLVGADSVPHRSLTLRDTSDSQVPLPRSVDDVNR